MANISLRRAYRQRLVRKYRYWREKVNPRYVLSKREDAMFGNRLEIKGFQGARGKSNQFLRKQIKELKRLDKDLMFSKLTGKVYDRKKTDNLRSNIKSVILGNYERMGKFGVDTTLQHQAERLFNQFTRDTLNLYYSWIDSLGIVGIMADVKAWYFDYERIDPITGKPYNTADIQARRFLESVPKFRQWLRDNYGVDLRGRKLKGAKKEDGQKEDIRL